jgi:hypothetical protein
MYLNALIILFCIITLIIYTSTKNFDSLKGILIILFASSALLVKIFLLNEVNFKLIVLPTFLISGLINLILSIFGFLLIQIIRIKNRKIKPGFLIMLFILYLPFAFLQQTFFQYIFLNTLSFFFAGKFLVLTLGVLFFGSFHLPRETAKMTVLSIIAGTIWMWTYLNYGNLIWPILSHAILAPFYFCFVHPGDRLSARLKYLRIG